MNKTLALSAFACDPTKGSEPGYGWNWAIGLASKGYDVHCFTRAIGRDGIEDSFIPGNLKFHYVTLPLGLEKLYTMSTPGMYLYYLLWQWLAYRAAKKVHRKKQFTVAHHVTWGSIQLGSFMYKLGVPFIFGPAGGGQSAPETFKKYFLNHWHSEVKRNKITRVMLKYNPACKKMLKRAHVVFVSNPETEVMVRAAGAGHVVSMLDATLPNTFFPEEIVDRNLIKGNLRLLWVGRFLPRKGILLLLEVMRELKNYTGITLTVVGDGEMRDQFLSLINNYQLESTVHWKGKVEFSEVKDFYSTHDVFLFTSLRDSGGVQLVEAMAYGLPVVCLKLHGQDVIVNDETGIRCLCPDPETAILNLKLAILKLSNDPELTKRKSRAAYEFALMQTWDLKIEHTIENYYPKT